MRDFAGTAELCKADRLHNGPKHIGPLQLERLEM